MSADSFVGNMLEPLSRNLYVYAAADPVNLVDPSGHLTLTDTAIAIAVIGFVLSSFQGILGAGAASVRGSVEWNGVHAQLQLGAGLGPAGTAAVVAAATKDFGRAEGNSGAGLYVLVRFWRFSWSSGTGSRNHLRYADLQCAESNIWSNRSQTAPRWLLHVEPLSFAGAGQVNWMGDSGFRQWTSGWYCHRK